MALTTEKRALEYRVITANRTLAYGLGRALIEARSLKGLIALPGKIRRLSSKQKAKRRERVPNSFADDIGERLRLVDPALDQAGEQGIEAAAIWIRSEKASSSAKARALTELAHWVVDRDVRLAASLGIEALALDPKEHRLLALALRLRDAGQVRVPAELCTAIVDRQSLSPGQRVLCELLIEDAAILETGVWAGSSDPVDRSDAEGAGVAILCPPRWAGSSRVKAAQDAAVSAGLVPTIRMTFDDADLAKNSIVHIFADSVGSACDAAFKAAGHGGRIILDIANPPGTVLDMSGSERAAVETARLKGVAALSRMVIARSSAAARQLQQLGIAHAIVPDAGAETQPEPAPATVSAAFVEYGAAPGTRTIAMAATLDEDANLLRCLETFAAIAEETDQLLVFGKGRYASILAHRVGTLGIASRVHFVGLPPQQRWPALLTGLELMVFPSALDEPLGSEIPALLVQAIDRNRPVLASETAWNAQASWQRDFATTLDENGDWADQMRAMLAMAIAPDMESITGESMVDIYKAIVKSL